MKKKTTLDSSTSKINAWFSDSAHRRIAGGTLLLVLISVIGGIIYAVGGGKNLGLQQTTAAGLWKYVPLNAQQAIYLELNDTTRDSFLKGSEELGQDMQALVNNVETILVGQDIHEGQATSFLVGTVEDSSSLDEVEKTIKENEQDGFVYDLLDETTFVYAQPSYIDAVKNNTLQSIGENQIYQDLIVDQTGNFVFYMVIDETAQALLAPNLSSAVQDINHVVAVADVQENGADIAFHILFNDAIAFENYSFSSKFDKYFSSSNIANIELGPIVLQAIGMDKQQILQSAQAFLPLYETSFQSLQPKDYQTVIDSIDENIFVGIQPAEGTIPLQASLLFNNKDMADVLTRMKPGLKNILSSTFPTALITDATAQDTQGFSLEFGEGGMNIQAQRGTIDDKTFIVVGENPRIGSNDSVAIDVDSQTLATMQISFDPIIDTYSNYMSLLALVQTGVVDPTSELERLRGKTAQGYVTTKDNRLSMFIKAE